MKWGGWELLYASGIWMTSRKDWVESFKLMRREGCLLTLAKLARKVGASGAGARCALCNTGEAEDMPRLVLRCQHTKTRGRV